MTSKRGNKRSATTLCRTLTLDFCEVIVTIRHTRQALLDPSRTFSKLLVQFQHLQSLVPPRLVVLVCTPNQHASFINLVQCIVPVDTQSSFPFPVFTRKVQGECFLSNQGNRVFFSFFTKANMPTDQYLFLQRQHGKAETLCVRHSLTIF